MSAANDVAAEILAALSALGLSVGGSPVGWIERKLPAVDDTLDVLPVGILTPPGEPDADTPFDTGAGGTGRRLHEYVYDVTLVAAGNWQLQTGLPDYRAAREAISFRFGRARPLATAGVLWVRPTPRALLD